MGPTEVSILPTKHNWFVLLDMIYIVLVVYILSILI